MNLEWKLDLNGNTNEIHLEILVNTLMNCYLTRLGILLALGGPDPTAAILFFAFQFV